jgi:hypothetical protein
VRRRKPTTLGIIGTALACIGVVGLTWGSLDEFRPERIGIAALLIGVTLICYQRLATKNLAADEIYNVGRERGEADGYEAGYEEGRADGQRSRPFVVPLPVQTCPCCGESMSLQSVGSVADRG